MRTLLARLSGQPRKGVEACASRDQLGPVANWWRINNGRLALLRADGDPAGGQNWPSGSGAGLRVPVVCCPQSSPGFARRCMPLASANASARTIWALAAAKHRAPVVLSQVVVRDCGRRPAFTGPAQGILCRYQVAVRSGRLARAFFGPPPKRGKGLFGPALRRGVIGLQKLGQACFQSRSHRPPRNAVGKLAVAGGLAGCTAHCPIVSPASALKRTRFMLRRSSVPRPAESRESKRRLAQLPLA